MRPSGGASATPAAPKLLVLQARVLAEDRVAFEDWLRQYDAAVEQQDGHLDYDLTPPTPGMDEDWVLVHRFVDRASAVAWIGSAEHAELLEAARGLVIGELDVHLVGSSAGRQGKVSALFTTHVDAGREDEFLEWSTRMAAAQAAFDGFAGYQVERPIEGVQPDWVAILSFDTDEHMRAWLSSSQRAALLAEGASFAPRARVRFVHGGLDAWFNAPGGDQPAAPVWKRNMLVLLVLYPVVFLTAVFIQTPLLSDNGLPLWAALFIANIISVATLGWLLVPATDRAFRWWLYPARAGRGVTLAGAALVVGLYGLSLVLAAWISSWGWP